MELAVFYPQTQLKNSVQQNFYLEPINLVPAPPAAETRDSEHGVQLREGWIEKR